MKQLSKTEIHKIRRAEQKNIQNIQIEAMMGVLAIREYVNDFFANTVYNQKELKTLENALTAKYLDIFNSLKENIVVAYNDIGETQVNAYRTLIPYIPSLAIVFDIPNTPYFKVTNRLFAPRSISLRSKYLAKGVTNIIEKGFEANLSIKEIQKQLDIQYGYRNKQGIVTPKSKALIQNGKFTHANGNIYQTYRIARTEVMRASAGRMYEIYEGVERADKRLKLLAIIDSHTREQSAQMNGQISNEKGEFKYPDGRYYRLGAAPPQWSINDRETAYIVFLDN